MGCGCSREAPVVVGPPRPKVRRQGKGTDIPRQAVVEPLEDQQQSPSAASLLATPFEGRVPARRGEGDTLVACGDGRGCRSGFGPVSSEGNCKVAADLLPPLDRRPTPPPAASALEGMGRHDEGEGVLVSNALTAMIVRSRPVTVAAEGGFGHRSAIARLDKSATRRGRRDSTPHHQMTSLLAAADSSPQRFGEGHPSASSTAHHDANTKASNATAIATAVTSAVGTTSNGHAGASNSYVGGLRAEDLRAHTVIMKERARAERRAVRRCAASHAPVLCGPDCALRRLRQQQGIVAVGPAQSRLPAMTASAPLESSHSLAQQEGLPGGAMPALITPRAVRPHINALPLSLRGERSAGGPAGFAQPQRSLAVPNLLDPISEHAIHNNNSTVGGCSGNASHAPPMGDHKWGSDYSPQNGQQHTEGGVDEGLLGYPENATCTSGIGPYLPPLSAQCLLPQPRVDYKDAFLLSLVSLKGTPKGARHQHDSTGHLTSDQGSSLRRDLVSSVGDPSELLAASAASGGLRLQQQKGEEGAAGSGRAVGGGSSLEGLLATSSMRLFVTHVPDEEERGLSLLLVPVPRSPQNSAALNGRMRPSSFQHGGDHHHDAVDGDGARSTNNSRNAGGHTVNSESLQSLLRPASSSAFRSVGSGTDMGTARANAGDSHRDSMCSSTALGVVKSPLSHESHPRCDGAPLPAIRGGPSSAPSAGGGTPRTPAGSRGGGAGGGAFARPLVPSSFAVGGAMGGTASSASIGSCLMVSAQQRGGGGPGSLSPSSGSEHARNGVVDRRPAAAAVGGSGGDVAGHFANFVPPPRALAVPHLSLLGGVPPSLNVEMGGAIGARGTVPLDVARGGGGGGGGAQSINSLAVSARANGVVGRDADRAPGARGSPHRRHSHSRRVRSRLPPSVPLPIGMALPYDMLGDEEGSAAAAALDDEGGTPF